MLQNQLLHDEKQCAEHIMLVDLGRNDVGKVILICFYYCLICYLIHGLGVGKTCYLKLCRVYSLKDCSHM